MPPPLGLVNLSAPDLIAAAGGDPWKINDELQAGDPGAINAQADAFHAAAGSATEVEDDFKSAKQRFEKGWQHNGAEHPINESAQVTQATTTMHMQKSQLGKTALDLENVAAALVSAQLNASGVIAGLDNQLHAIDDAMGTAKANNQDTTALHDQAVAAVKSALEQVKGDQSAYSSVMAAAKPSMSTVAGEAPAGSGAPGEPGSGDSGEKPGEKPFRLTPTKGEVAVAAGGTVAGTAADGVRGAALDAMKDAPRTGPGAVDPGLLKWLEDPKIKGFSRLGRVVGAAGAIPAVFSDISDGNSVSEAVARETAGTVVGLGGSALGAAGGEAAVAMGGEALAAVGADALLGAEIGSIVPGAGTVVGLAAGAVVGTAAAFLVSKGVEFSWKPVANAVGSAVHDVESIFGFG